MKITWDEPKRIANLEKHGLDFADLDDEFFLSSIIGPAKSSRYKALGRTAGGIVAVIFVTLGSEAVSIISMRPAGRNERRLF